MMSRKNPANTRGNHEDPRTLAARILTRVVKDGSSLDRLIPDMTYTLLSDRDKAFTRELCYGVLRWYPRLVFILEILLDKPFKKKDLDIRSAMLCGLYQLEYLRTPAHAAVSSSVEVAKGLNKSWAGPAINAVLRRYQREHLDLNRRADENEPAYFAHPEWLICALRDDWPEHWQGILRSNNERPTMQLRVNLSLVSREEYLNELNRAEIAAAASTLHPAGIELAGPVAVESLPGFNEGKVSVQDYGAQLAAPLLDLHPGHAVLDACAAPGGKSAHIFEIRPDLQRLTALDLSRQRIHLLNATKTRLNTAMDVIQGDARQPESWWDGMPYDRILLDVPCSATGVIRRHPDIKILRRPADIAGFTVTQQQLLDSMWPLLKSKGRLVYATCSLLIRENDQQLEIFTRKHADARVTPIEPEQEWGIATKSGRQTVPGYDNTDGFYYAILEKA